MADDEYKRVAAIEFERLRQMQEFCMKMQGDYGKWLISSLLFLHGAAIGGLLFKSTSNGLPPYFASIWWFVFGIVFALGAGFAAWWNFTFAADLYNRWADYRMLSDVTCWPKGDDGIKVEVTKWASIITGVASVVCIIGGAASVYCSWY